MSRKFIEACLAGEANESEIDNYVERWHTGDSHLDLHEFLGMTLMEYGAWVESPKALTHIIEHRKHR